MNLGRKTICIGLFSQKENIAIIGHLTVNQLGILWAKKEYGFIGFINLID